ncbi:MAG: sigma-70 family RNA polymerase sigma factor [Bacteroidales bacterium]|nr:sigma-70 family RNA polymerase sigma factor [Bacteroidales bacterium]
MQNERKITEGIAAHDSKILLQVYKENFPYVRAYVENHGGNEQQAKDIFQEAMIIVYQKIKADKFQLYCKFSTYLYAVCKRLWIQDRKKWILRMNKLKEMPAVSEPEKQYGNDDPDLARQLFDKYFTRLSPDCQKLLRLYFNGLSMEEITTVMNMSNVHHTSDKKYRCKKKLIDRIKNDPLFAKLKK